MRLPRRERCVSLRAELAINTAFARRRGEEEGADTFFRPQSEDELGDCLALNAASGASHRRRNRAPDERRSDERTCPASGASKWNRAFAKSDDDGGLPARDARAARARIDGCTPTSWRTYSAGVPH
jgi:hypothetical protein